MRSDLRDTSDTITKMIQFGTVKYGIVKQLKDRSRSERDAGSDQEDQNGTSLPCSPVAECKSTSPDLHDDDHNNGSSTLEDHNHNNNIANDHVSSLKNDTYPALHVEHEDDVHSKRTSPVSPSTSPSSHRIVVSPKRRRTRSESQDEDDNISDGENDNGAHEKDEESPNTAQPPQEMEDDSDQSKIAGAAAAAMEMLSNRSTNSSPATTMPQFPNPPMTLEAIQNMQIAIAQFAAKTLANGGADNEAAMKQLAFLQQTLFNLQQQQIFQLQLIQQLQSQLAMNQMKTDDDHENNDDEDDEGDGGECSGLEEDGGRSQLNCVESSPNNHHHQSRSHRSSMDLSESESRHFKDGRNSSMDISDECEKIKEDRTASESDKFEMASSRVNMPKDVSLPKQDENTPLPYGSDLASSIITNHDEPPSLDEPNSLEMLQKRAQEVLDSASQGILAGNLADEFAFGKDRTGDGKNRNEPFFKHRCRYCGKVFGSDSALQIHIRSHTGERPFKCNVCGSRFTTKGNLKVHFQRHAQKFPNVPMNSTPIPEHLDKFHPPLLEQMSPETSPQHPSSMPHVPNVPVTLPLPFPPGAGFPGLPLYRPPLEILKSLGPYPSPFFGAMPSMPPMPPKRDVEQPTDLRKPQAPQPPVAATSPKIKEEGTEEPKDFEPISLRIKEEKREQEETASVSPKSTRSPPPPPPVTSQHSTPLVSSSTSLASPVSSEATRLPQPSPLYSSQPLQSSVSVHPPVNVLQQMQHLSTLSGNREAEFHDRLHLNDIKSSPERRSPIRSPVSIPRSPFLGPMKHEMALLPRPHSNDNSWENFIEVSNTSETVKLKELMKNKKITDPNQCVVCDRVLSCKSALQMHYRTHTGERPFKCRICGRAFTTKGNLKTHMAVHKIRPPMRNFHQCPVCHKKYSNALVLQQHIRLHTGEPTDLTPEQIQAAEIRDFPPTMVPGSFINPFAFSFGMPPSQNGHMGSESSQGDNDDAMDCSDDFDDEDISDHMSNGGDDMKGMLEQKLKIDSTSSSRPKSEASTSSAPTSPVSAINKCSPVPSDTSQGALDLTPRSSLPQPPIPPHLMPNRPPFGMFPNLPIFPPVSSTTQNMCNAMNSIAQSVMPAAPFNPLALSGVRGSTTCGICFKTFPCHSALEIHYRSHTKERPFKCSICDRGFTTKGNLKQHMLTHKIRDMEQDAFRNRAVKYMSNWKEGFE